MSGIRIMIGGVVGVKTATYEGPLRRAFVVKPLESLPQQIPMKPEIINFREVAQRLAPERSEASAIDDLADRLARFQLGITFSSEGVGTIDREVLEGMVAGVKINLGLNKLLEFVKVRIGEVLLAAKKASPPDDYQPYDTERAFSIHAVHDTPSVVPAYSVSKPLLLKDLAVALVGRLGIKEVVLQQRTEPDNGENILIKRGRPVPKEPDADEEPPTSTREDRERFLDMLRPGLEKLET